MSKSRLVYWVTLASAAVWLGSIFLAPLFVRSGRMAAAAFIYTLFSNVCHQIGPRCFHVAGRALPVCARCFGIYAGFFLALAVLPATAHFPQPPLPRLRLFLLLSLPMAIDFSLGFLGLYGSTNFIRFLTGLIWGAVVMPYFLTAMNELAALMMRPGTVPSGNGTSPGRRDTSGQA